MKKIFLFAGLLIGWFASQAQTQQVSVDTFKLKKASGYSELQIMNRTDTIPGFLFNVGNGATRFQRGLIRVNDSVYIVGADTLRLHTSTGGGGTTDSSVYSTRYYTQHNFYPLASNPLNYLITETDPIVSSKTVAANMVANGGVKIVGTASQGIINNPNWTFQIDSSITATKAYANKLRDSLAALISAGGGGLSHIYNRYGVIITGGDSIQVDTSLFVRFKDSATFATKYYVNHQGFLTAEADPVALAKSITDSAVTGGGIIIAAAKSQTLTSNPRWDFKADTSLLATITGVKDSVAGRVKYSDSTSIYQTKYRSDSARANLYAVLAAKVNYTDSATIYQTKYRSDTARVNYYAGLGSAVKYTDSATIYQTKYRSDSARANLYAALSGKVNYGDSAAVYFSKYRSDTMRANIYAAIHAAGTPFDSATTQGASAAGGFHTQVYNDLRYLNLFDTTGAVGYTTLASRQKMLDSLGIVLGLYRLYGDTTGTNSTATRGYVGKARDSLGLIIGAKVANAAGVPLLGASAYSSRPAASASAGLWLVTDSLQFSYSNGTAWTWLTNNPNKVWHLFVRGQGQPGDTSYVFANPGDSTIRVAAQRDSLAYHTAINADGSRTHFVDVPSTPIRNELGLASSPTVLHVIGTSIDVGYPGTTGQSWPNQAADSLPGLAMTNYAITNSSAMDIINQGFTNEAAVKATDVLSVGMGPNNIREDTATGPVKWNVIREGLRTMIANHFMDTVWAISNSAITKGGTWANITAANFLSKSIKQSLGNPMYSSTIGSTLTTVVNDQTIVIGTYGWKAGASYGSVTISIDGVLQINPQTNSTTWSGSNQSSQFISQIGTYDVRQPIAWVFTNLGIGPHTVVITLLQNLETDFDYIGKLMLPKNGAPLVAWHVSKATTAGYASYSATLSGPAGIDSANRYIDTVVNYFRRAGYPIATARENEFLNGSMYYTDGLHFLASGYLAFANCFLNLINRNSGSGGYPLSDTATTAGPGYMSAIDKQKLANQLVFGSNSSKPGDTTTRVALGPGGVNDTLFQKNIRAGYGLKDSVTLYTIMHSVDTTKIPTVTALNDSIANAIAAGGTANVTVTTTSALAAGSFSTAKIVVTTDIGKAGTWVYNAAHNGTPGSGDGGLVIIDAAGHGWDRLYDGYHTAASWWGFNAANTSASNTSILTAFLPMVQGKAVYMGTGYIRLDSISTPNNLTDVLMYGGGYDSTILYGTVTVQMWWLNNMTRVTWQDMQMYDTVHETALDYGRGLIYSDSRQTKDLHFNRVKFKTPNANTGAVNFLIRHSNPYVGGAQSGGQINGIYFDDCVWDSVGQSMLSMLNRDTTRQAYDARDSLRNIHIRNFKWAHAGLMGSYGLGVTFDGYSNETEVGWGDIQDMFQIGIEYTGGRNMHVHDITAHNHQTIRPWETLGLSPFNLAYPITDGLFDNIHDLDTAVAGTSGSGVQAINNSIFQNDVWQSGTGHFVIKDANNNRFINERWNGVGPTVLILTSVPSLGATTIGNQFYDVQVTNPTTVNTNLILFDSVNTNQNMFYNTAMSKISGTYTIQNDNAANNGFVNPNTGSAYTNKAITIGISDATNTLTSDQAMFDYDFYKFTGTVTKIDTVYFPTTNQRTFKLQNRVTGNFPLAVCLKSSLSCVLLAPNITMSITSDSINWIATAGSFSGQTGGSQYGQPLELGSNILWYNGTLRIGPWGSNVANGVPYYDSTTMAVGMFDRAEYKYSWWQTRPRDSMTLMPKKYIDSLITGLGGTYVSVLSPQLLSSSVAGYVWTANSTTGLGTWSPTQYPNINSPGSSVSVGGTSNNVSLDINPAAAITWTGITAFNSPTTLTQPILGSTSVSGQVWTATNTTGGGHWATPTTGTSMPFSYITSTGSAPSVSIGAAVPSGGSITGGFSGASNALRGTWSFNAGTGTGTGSTIATFTIPTQPSGSNYIVLLNQTSGGYNTAFVTNKTSTSFQLQTVSGSPIPASTSYAWDYLIIN